MKTMADCSLCLCFYIRLFKKIVSGDSKEAVIVMKEWISHLKRMGK